MLQKIAKGISYLLHPVFIPSYLVLALKWIAPLPVFYVFMGNKLFLALFLLTFTYTAIIPLLFVYLQYRMNFIKDFTLNHRNERPRVYLFTSGFFLAVAYFLNAKGSVFMPTAVIFTSMAVNIIGLFLMNFFDKISAHVSGISGVLGVFVALFFRYADPHMVPAMLTILLLVGIISSSRLFLGAHNLRQVVIGGLWGFITGFVGVYYFMKL